MRWDSAWAQRAYYVHTRRSWRLLVLLGAAAMYLLVLFEPKGSTWQARHRRHHSRPPAEPMPGRGLGGRGSGVGGRGSGIGVGAFASRQLAWPRQSQALGAHRGESPPPRRHLSPQKVIGEHGVKATPYGPSES